MTDDKNSNLELLINDRINAYFQDLAAKRHLIKGEGFVSHLTCLGESIAILHKMEAEIKILTDVMNYYIDEDFNRYGDYKDSYAWQKSQEIKDLGRMEVFLEKPSDSKPHSTTEYHYINGEGPKNEK